MRTLPIRTWLALALVAILAVPWLTAGALYEIGVRPRQDHRGASAWVDSAPKVIQEIERNPSRWADRTWQAQIRRKLTAAGLNAVLTDRFGREVFRSTDASRARADAQGGLLPQSTWLRRVPEGTAYVYGRGQLDTGALSGIVIVLAALTSLLLTLAGVAWFIDRAVLKPLSAMGEAARQIAGGELSFQIPPSRVREVAEVATAMGAMGDALRASLHRQAEMEQERRLFIASIVHDLRTPLFSLRGYLEGLANGVAGTPEKVEKYVEVCREKAAAMERLISDLFSYAQLEYLDQVPQPEPLELGSLLTKVVDGLRPQAEAKGVSIHLEGPAALDDSGEIGGQPEPCPFLGDGHQITRAVENLLDNALRHTPPGGRVRVSWGKDLQDAGTGSQAGSPRLVFSIADTGPGIDPHDLPHLFKPLYRGEASRNRRTGGAGLGLAISRRILQAHGGDLTAANRKEGGAVFTGLLPVLGSGTTDGSLGGGTGSQSF